MNSPRSTTLWNGGSERKVPAEGGFTPPRKIVLITISGLLGFLVVLIVPSLFVVRMAGMSEKVRFTKIRHDLKSIVEVAELMYSEMGRYPQTLETIKNSLGDPEGRVEVALIALEKTRDPWNNEYLYDLDKNGKPRARCLGKDGAEGGEGDDRDYEYPGPEGSRPPSAANRTAGEVRK